MSTPLARTPLYSTHVEEGAKLSPFAGFEMPVVYSSIIDEHRAVRSCAGLFDVSHMGEVRFRGPDAIALAQQIFSNDVAGTAPGRARYGILCLDDGGAVDDVLLYRVGENEVLFCLNASNIAADLAWIHEVHGRGSLEVEIIDESESTALLAIQGPAALEITHELAGPDLKPPRRWRFAEAELEGVPVWLSRTGYTGEDGYEIYAPADGATQLWKRLREVGGTRLVPAGLGARDTLRTEMGYALYGHELDRTRTPIAAGLERSVAFGKGFVGEAALARDRDDGEERLVGLVLEGRRVARSGYPILTDAGRGIVTSGTHGPSVERSIAMGYVPTGAARLGAKLRVEIRDRAIPCEVVKTPFFNRKS
ncbi:MAG: glycine cleavage system aminomethyltransferase GcvT [bacterium]|nr:glycine cleavage system aminomethyltransferase GcvT [bacterium]